MLSPDEVFSIDLITRAKFIRAYFLVIHQSQSYQVYTKINLLELRTFVKYIVKNISYCGQSVVKKPNYHIHTA